MTTISVRELHTLQQTQPASAVLDVRTPAEFGALHVAGSRNTPLTSPNLANAVAAAKLTPAEPVYLLCQTGARATLAAETFAREGLTNAVVVDGGVRAWQDAGLPLEIGARSAMSLERQVRIAAGSLVLLGVIGAYIVHPYFIGISAFVGAGLVFAGITDWCGMALLLARLPWNRHPAPE